MIFRNEMAVAFGWNVPSLPRTTPEELVSDVTLVVGLPSSR